MSGGPILALAALAAIWPFNRDRGDEATGTIKDLESRVVEVDTETEIDAGERKAIESYRAFLELASEDPLLRAEAMRRLADLEIETAEAEQAGRDLDAIGAALADSIELYRRLLESYPSYAKNDLVLYQLARAYEARGDIERSLATLDRLVTEYPRTPHLHEANFRRGEALFVAERYAEAEEAYRRVLDAGPGTAFYEQSLYKHGWSLFKQLRYEEALDSFFALLDRELAVTDGGDPALVYQRMGRAEQELVTDSLRVVSISFSYLDGPASIARYLDIHGTRPYAYIVYKSLGDLYLEQERFQDAAAAYRAFPDMDPWHEKAPLLQAEVEEAFERGGFPDLVLDAKRAFVERYGPASPYWQRYSLEEQPDVAARLEGDLTDLAAYHHAEAQRTGAPEEYAEAARWYRTYLASFPSAEQAPEMNFLLAEVLFESGSYRDAAIEYERTAYAYPYHEQSAEAGYAALLAYGRHEETLDGTARAEWHRRGIDSALRFASTYPADARAPAVETDAAERLFELGELAAARDVAQRVLAREPAADPGLQRVAWTVVAHSEFDLGAYDAAEAAYLRLAAFVPPDDPEHDALVERIASSIYKQGEQAQARGDDRAAVEHFLRVGTAAPGSSIRATAEYDAAAALIRLEDWPRAAAVLEGFRQRFPEHELAADVTAKLAVAYVETGDLARAAAEFERVAEADGDTAVKREALWRAADLYMQSDLDTQAAAALERYVEQYPRPAPVAIEARRRLADLAIEHDDYTAQMRWLAAIVEADAAAGDERTDRTRLLAARAQLELAAPLRNAFRAVRLVAPLEESLAVKRERMEAALAAYTKAVDYGIADVTTAATYEIAELYHTLGRDLIESERPADLDALALEQYEILLEEQAFPFEERAIEVHEVNTARAADGVYDEWVRKSFEALATLVPVRYAKHEIGETIVATLR
ncbi:MAG TPA: tetratricopeptide repeat protein [Gammaproteobacteria bacterium]